MRALDNLAPPVHLGDGTWPDWLSKDVDRVAGDVRNRDDWAKALRGIDVVIHLAAYQDLRPNFSQFFHVNSVGTALLYELIVRGEAAGAQSGRRQQPVRLRGRPIPVPEGR